MVKTDTEVGTGNESSDTNSSVTPHHCRQSENCDTLHHHTLPRVSAPQWVICCHDSQPAHCSLYHGNNSLGNWNIEASRNLCMHLSSDERRRTSARWQAFPLHDDVTGPETLRGKQLTAALDTSPPWLVLWNNNPPWKLFQKIPFWMCEKQSKQMQTSTPRDAETLCMNINIKLAQVKHIRTHAKTDWNCASSGLTPGILPTQQQISFAEKKTHTHFFSIISVDFSCYITSLFHLFFSLNDPNTTLEFWP